MASRYTRFVRNGMITFRTVQGKKEWMTLNSRFAILATDEPSKDDHPDREDGTEVYVYFPMDSADTLYQLKLTDLTWSEYSNLRKILSDAMKMAAPIIKIRDANAAKKLESGEIAPPRAYRTISKLFNSEGEVK